MSKAVVALDVVGVDDDLNRLLQGTACKYRPHITILPKCDLEQLGGLTATNPVLDLAGLTVPPRILLRGPVAVDPSMAWYECQPDCEGWTSLIALHGALLTRVEQRSEHASSVEFAGAAYRPHMTVQWHVPVPSADSLQRELWVVPQAFALYEYQLDPQREDVRRTQLSGPGGSRLLEGQCRDY